ncbi:hypothetical protein BHE74_00022830, partial [Ensete ventricosum]
PLVSFENVIDVHVTLQPTSSSMDYEEQKVFRGAFYLDHIATHKRASEMRPTNCEPTQRHLHSPQSTVESRTWTTPVRS